MPDEDKTFRGFLVLILRISWRHVYTLYSAVQIDYRSFLKSSHGIRKKIYKHVTDSENNKLERESKAGLLNTTILM